MRLKKKILYFATIVFATMTFSICAIAAEVKAGQSSISTSIKEIATDGWRFLAYNNGTVLDTNTGLLWASKDNGEGINWYDAKEYCENYKGGGYTDWRLPTQEELAGLYERGKSYQAIQQKYDVHLTELIQLSACCPWVSETRGSMAAHFNFAGGKWNWQWQWQVISYLYRALPVRSDK